MLHVFSQFVQLCYYYGLQPTGDILRFIYAEESTVNKQLYEEEELPVAALLSFFLVAYEKAPYRKCHCSCSACTMSQEGNKQHQSL